MHPKSNNIGHYFNAESIAFQGVGLSAGPATPGAAVELKLRASFVLVGAFAGTSGTPTTASITFAVQASSDGTTFAAANDRDGNPVSMTVTAANKVGSVNVDTQYFPIGSTHYRVVPTVAFTGGSSPTASFVALDVRERADHL